MPLIGDEWKFSDKIVTIIALSSGADVIMSDEHQRVVQSGAGCMYSVKPKNIGRGPLLGTRWWKPTTYIGQGLPMLIISKGAPVPLFICSGCL